MMIETGTGSKDFRMSFKKIINMNAPTVSVLMTAYNREKYIAEAIESVIASTYQDWELIIVDDCSTDRTVEITRSYEAKDSRIKVYVNEKNLGQFPNRNKAASYAKGKYLKYLDSDDIIYPHGLGIMVEALDKFPSAGFALQDVYNTVTYYPFIVKKDDAIREYFKKDPFLIVGPSGVIFRKEAFNKVGGFNSDNCIGNDTRILLLIALIYDVVKLPPQLIFWREHENQEFKKALLVYEYSLNDDKVIKEIIHHHLCPLTEKEKQAALLKLRNLIVLRTIRFLKTGKIFIFFKLLKKAITIHSQAHRLPSYINTMLLKFFRIFNGHPINTFLSGKGIIFAFHRVVESKVGIFNGILEISQDRFEFTINYLKWHNYDFISLDELPERLKSKSNRKFAIITFDDGYKDNYTIAYPILKKYNIPFTIYLSTSFPDGMAIIWWYMLEEIIINNSSISFSYDGMEYNYSTLEMADKERVFDLIRSFIIDSTPLVMQSKIKSVLSSYIPDMYAKTKELALSWEEVKSLSEDPMVTIGNHTVNHYAMTVLSKEESISEILTAQEIIKEKIGITTKHFAYPFGSRKEVNYASVEILNIIRYSTATTTIPGNIFSEHLDHDMYFVLPRHLICEKISKYAPNIRLNGIYPFFVNNYNKLSTLSK